MHHRSLPVARPCHERFLAMEDRGTRRFCDRCQEEVHDLSSMSRAQARYFLMQRQGQALCVRYEIRPDQTLRFRPPPARAAGPMLAVMAGLMAACTGHLEAAELDSPEEGLMCRDESGYTIPCLTDDAGELEVGVEPELELEPEVEPEPSEPSEPTGLPDELVELDDEWTVDDLLMPEPADQSEGCPLQTWDEGGRREGELMGRTEIPFYSKRQRRQIAKEHRQEQRRARRRARRRALSRR